MAGAKMRVAKAFCWLSLEPLRAALCYHNGFRASMWKPLVPLLLTLAGAVRAGDDRSATALIERAAKRVRAATMQEAEFTVAAGASPDGANEIRFRLAVEKTSDGRTNRARMEATAGPNPLVRLCEGTSRHTWLAAVNRYWIDADAAPESCSFPVNEWVSLDRNLHSPEIVGHETVRNSGRDFGNVIDVPADLWRFRAPDGSAETPPPAVEPDIATGPPAVNATALPPDLYLIGGKITTPALLHKVEPSYTKAARRARIAGVVVLAGEIWPDDKAHKLEVRQSLDPGLEEEAIHAVAKWEFKPATRDGKPIRLLSTFEVNFKLQ